MKNAPRPYVICHMVPSIDGRIVPIGWKLTSAAIKEYELTAQTFGSNAWIIGRISMEPYAGKAKVPKRKGKEKIPRTDHIAAHDGESYAIAIDPSGKLTWKSGYIDDEHVVTVITQKVSDDYLAFLRSKGVSYIFGGKSKVDLKTVLTKLHTYFAIEKLLLEGGGKINGSFLAADLIDEFSVLVAPVADGSVGSPSLLDSKEGQGPVRHLKLISVEKRATDFVWLRYEVKRA